RGNPSTMMSSRLPRREANSRPSAWPASTRLRNGFSNISLGTFSNIRLYGWHSARIAQQEAANRVGALPCVALLLLESRHHPFVAATAFGVGESARQPRAFLE